MIHSDVKPQNILITSTCDIKLADFGIIHYQDSDTINLTCAKDGSPFYMAPEMLQGKPIDSSVDIWALGMTAFEMMTGVPLTLTKCSSYNEWVRKNNPKWSNNFKGLLQSMLSNDPSLRPSAHELLNREIILNLNETWILISEQINDKNNINFLETTKTQC